VEIREIRVLIENTELRTLNLELSSEKRELRTGRRGDGETGSSGSPQERKQQQQMQ
jgi:hypothetical protein